MELLWLIIPILILVILILAFIGMWRGNTDRMTDYQLYGMDAEEYLKLQVGEEQYNKYYKPKRLKY